MFIHLTHTQTLFQSAYTWTPVEALQLHAVVWSGDPLSSLDGQMLPLAGTRRLPLVCREQSGDATLVHDGDGGVGSMAADDDAAAAARADAAANDTVSTELAEVPYHSPWALGGTSR